MEQGSGAGEAPESCCLKRLRGADSPAAAPERVPGDADRIAGNLAKSAALFWGVRRHLHGSDKKDKKNLFSFLADIKAISIAFAPEFHYNLK